MLAEPTIDGAERARPNIAAGRGAKRDAIVHAVLSLDPGGTERLVIDLARRLAGEFEPVVCCLDDAGEWASELAEIGVEVVPLKRQEGFRPSLGWQLSKVAARYHASLVHCHHYSPFVYGAIAMACRRNLRVVYTEHGRLSDAPPTRKRRLVNPCLGLLPHRMYAVSHDLRRHMIAEGFPPGRIDVIHNGIDPGPRAVAGDRARARHRLGIPEHAFVVGTVARLDPVKDLGTLMIAFHLLRPSSTAARLVVVGDGPDRLSLIDAARAAGVADRVTFTGYRADARDLLPAFDVYANSSISEGVSLTILEAMASSLPIVATSVGGTPEVVTVGEVGLLVPSRTPTALANALRDLAASPHRRRALGAAGRRRVEDCFALDRMVAAYRQVYSTLAAEDSR